MRLDAVGASPNTIMLRRVIYIRVVAVNPSSTRNRVGGTKYRKMPGCEVVLALPSFTGIDKHQSIENMLNRCVWRSARVYGHGEVNLYHFLSAFMWSGNKNTGNGYQKTTVQAGKTTPSQDR